MAERRAKWAVEDEQRKAAYIKKRAERAQKTAEKLATIGPEAKKVPMTLHEKNEQHLKILKVITVIYSLALIVAGFIFLNLFGIIFALIVIAMAKGTIDRAEQRALVKEQRAQLKQDPFKKG